MQMGTIKSTKDQALVASDFNQAKGKNKNQEKNKKQQEKKK